jgi:hypothetical protein
MTAGMASAVALALSYAGMAGLSLAMDRHCEQATGRSEVPARQRLALRGVASALLALALLACAGAWGATVGLIAWLGFLTAGGLLVGVLMAYGPRLAVRAAGTALVFGLLAGCAGTALGW